MSSQQVTSFGTVSGRSPVHKDASGPAVSPNMDIMMLVVIIAEVFICSIFSYINWVLCIPVCNQHSSWRTIRVTEQLAWLHSLHWSFLRVLWTDSTTTGQFGLRSHLGWMRCSCTRVFALLHHSCCGKCTSTCTSCYGKLGCLKGKLPKVKSG